MIFGIPKEIRGQERRVGAMPFLVKELVKRGHQVLLETGAGEYCEAPDSRYERFGASVVPSAEKLYSQADVILKVREPKPVEYDLIRPDQAIFAYFHFLNNPELLKALAARGCTCLAYDFVEDESGQNPLVIPISHITGQMAVINGAFYLQKHNGGRGIVLGRVTGSPPAKVTILGAGNVGKEAAKTAARLGAEVFALDKNYSRLKEIDTLGISNITTLIYSDEILLDLIKETDLLISCIQVYNQPTPKIITQEMVKTMRPGSVIVEVDIDLGGSVETGKMTNHENPTFIVDGVVHYCVSNITSTVPIIASRGISAAMMPYMIEIAEKGLETALLEDHGLAKGIAIYKGHIVKPSLAKIAKLPCANLQEKIKELNWQK